MTHARGCSAVFPLAALFAGICVGPTVFAAPPASAVPAVATAPAVSATPVSTAPPVDPAPMPIAPAVDPAPMPIGASPSRETPPVALPSAARPPSALRGSLHEQPAETIVMPLSKIKPGMIGEAWTVFSGTKVEPFKVRVVSIVENFIPKQDIVLVQAEDPRVEFSGIAAGMSGSPVYIEGKLVGAIAYGWSFSKVPLAGVTPISSMFAEQSRPLRGSEDLIAVPQHGRPTTASRWGESGGAISGEGTVAAAAAPGAPTLQAVSVPLSISGLSSSAMNELTAALSQYGLVPLRTGGGGGGARRLAMRDPVNLAPGGMVGVQLIRGDMNASAMGTVTSIQGDKVFAFGHPMFGIGEVSLPMVTGEVHTFIPSQASSFKLASPLREVGAIVQDRPSCIVGDLGKRASMMPVEVHVQSPGMKDHVFRAEVARNKRLSPMLTSVVVTSAIADAEPDVTEMAVSMRSRLTVKGIGEVELRDELFSTEGLSPRALGMSRGLRALGDLLSNPFEPVTVERVDVQVRVEFRKDVAEIVDVSLPGDDVRAGDTVPLRVTLRPYAGREYSETIPVTIPSRLAGQQVKLEVASGGLVRPEVARPESLRGYIENLRSYYTASSIVVTMSLPDDGASLRGRLLPGLPQVALDTLRPGSQTRRADAFRLADRTVFSSSRLVQGRQEIVLNVREDLLGSRTAR